jgi:predicted phage tail protein
MLTAVTLDGEMGKRFGRVWALDLDTPSVSEALHALFQMCMGLREYLMERKESPYHVFVGDRSLPEDELYLPSGRKEIIIMPALAGAKSGGVLQIIVGAVLIVAGVVLSAYGYGVVGKPMVSAGIAMMIGGVAQLLFAPADPGKNQSEKPENKASYLFNGPVNTTGQGNCAAACYGEVEVGSQVLSAGIFTEEYAGLNSDAGTNGYNNGIDNNGDHRWWRYQDMLEVK